MGTVDDPDQARRRDEFVKVEYQEAAKLYSMGVAAGQDLMRQYLAGNTFLATIYGLTVAFEGTRAFSPYVGVGLSIAGLLCTIIMTRAIVLHRAHLLNCNSRCAALERHFDGHIFTDVMRTGAAARLKLHTLWSSATIIVGVLWAVLLFWLLIFVISGKVALIGA